MINLTIPKLVNSVLGGDSTVAYDKFVLSSITYDTVGISLRGTVRISSTAMPDMQAISGRLSIDVSSALLTIESEQLDFYRQVTLTGGQNTAVEGFIRDAQNELEAGLISIGVVDGVQATGS